MATHKVAAGAIGAYEVKLTANTVDTVEFESNLANVEIFGDGTAAIYLTLDTAEAPTVGGADCFVVPAGGPSSIVLPSKPNTPTVVKLISAGTPAYFVAKALV
jgi:hypothetical protein